MRPVTPGAVSIQKIWDKHSIKIGYEHRRYYSNITGGNFDITTERTRDLPVLRQSGDRSGPVCGLSVGRSHLGPGEPVGRTGIATDLSRRVRPGRYQGERKLTLNLGVRWDFEPPRTERYDRQIFWDATTNGTWTRTPVGVGTGASRHGITAASRLAHQRNLRTRRNAWHTGISGADAGSKPTPSLRSACRHRLPVLPRRSCGQLWNELADHHRRWFLDSAHGTSGYGDFARLAQDGTATEDSLTRSRSTSRMPGGLGYVRLTRDSTR